MAISIDSDSASEMLNALFDAAEADLLVQNPRPQVPEIDTNLNTVFSSSTQAYREALLGCFLAKLSDSATNVRKPYVSQGEDAFNGRTVEQMRRYFAQGHELNFVVIQDWAEVVLATIGSTGRVLFIQRMADLLDTADVPAALKVAWNESVNAVVNQ